MIDAVGIDVPGHPVADFFSMTLDEVFTRSFRDPGPFRIDPDYGRAYAAAIPTARFLLLGGTGHAPQLETPGLVLQAIRDRAEAGHPTQPR